MLFMAILAKGINDFLKNEMIHPAQMWFVQKSYMRDNIRITLDVTNKIHSNNKKVIMIILDAEKASESENGFQDLFLKFWKRWLVVHLFPTWIQSVNSKWISIIPVHHTEGGKTRVGPSPLISIGIRAIHAENMSRK